MIKTQYEFYVFWIHFLFSGALSTDQLRGYIEYLECRHIRSGDSVHPISQNSMGLWLLFLIFISEPLQMLVIANRPSKHVLQFLLVQIFSISGILAPMIIIVVDLDYSCIFFIIIIIVMLYQACKITIGLWNSEKTFNQF